MTLPTVNVPTFFLEIPSSKKKIKFRPFLVKEEKILLIALKENSEDVLFNAVKEIIANCTYGQLDVDKLTTVDIEFIFLNLRMKSKGSLVDLQFQCENEVDGKTCGYLNEIEFDLNNVQVVQPEEFKNKIMLTDSIGLIMKLPTIETTKKLFDALKSEDINNLYKVIPDYIDTIFDGETVFDTFTPEEFQEWIECLTDTQFQKIEEFFLNMPKLQADIPIKCDRCGHSETVTVEGLQNFLA